MKRIIGLNIKDRLKKLEKKISTAFGVGKDFFDRIQKAQTIKGKLGKLISSKLKTAFQRTLMYKKILKVTGSKKIFYISDKDLHPGYVKKSHNKRRNNPHFFIGERFEGPFHRTPQMANKHMRRCSTSVVLKEVRIKATVRYQCTPIKLKTQ